jgi:hypothetical protein
MARPGQPVTGWWHHPQGSLSRVALRSGDSEITTTAGDHCFGARPDPSSEPYGRACELLERTRTEQGTLIALDLA